MTGFLNNAADARNRLDSLFFADAVISIGFGILTILAPHGVIARFSENGYSHDAHEALRFVWIII